MYHPAPVPPPLLSGEAGEFGCAPRQIVVRLPTSRDNTSDRTSLKAGEDACVPGQSLSNTPLKGENIAGEDACVPGQLAQRRATVEKLNEENPNNCVVVGAMFFQNDTVPTEKSDYYYDKDKVMIASFDYEMRDTGWHCREYSYYEHIFLPHDTTNITFNIYSKFRTIR